MENYAHPEVLVSTEWVADHLGDANVRLVEVDVDTAAYDEGHIPGAIAWDWLGELCDTVRRDIIPRTLFERLMSQSGIAEDTTVVIYGDNNNWFAAWAFWQLKIYGHRDVRLMNGGRRKWLSEGRDLTLDVTPFEPRNYHACDPDFSSRAFLPEVLDASRAGSAALIDVRTFEEYTGEILAPPGLPETCQRGGHIPGAHIIPWETSTADDGCFRSYEELKQIYGSQGVDGSKPAITYCRIGERSSHTWFVLKYLLGFENAKNYDGSWTEWGNLVGVPVERGMAAVAGARL
jgi:thiosulfate/3-mercaptopyruvate sulfurtransferase